MATIVLGTVGTLLGGPLGGAIGALAGSQIDSKLFAQKGAEGPRLRDLAITTSTYGQPIARHFGQMRVPGTIIWATDLKEQREKQGSGKGKPKTTTYSYSASLAVALSSRPINGIGRIWADGNLLRGAADDLKVGGTMRFYHGHGDQVLDPLLAAVHGGQCPAYRHRAYVVFEDLQLGDFGNRIPTLSFEIDAGDASEIVGGLVDPLEQVTAHQATFPQLGGYSHENGSIAQNVAAISSVHPIMPVVERNVVSLRSANAGTVTLSLAEPAAWNDGDFGKRDGKAQGRTSTDRENFQALRYYDTDRDYQPGLQRTEGRAQSSYGRTVEFPGALTPTNARALAEAAADREQQLVEQLTWRSAEIDPAIVPGAIVRAPGMPGLWRVQNWEWREGGVELELTRYLRETLTNVIGDSGQSWSAPDLALQGSYLRVFELPWDGFGSATVSRVYAAVSAPSGAWSGAALYADSAGELLPIATSDSERAVVGTLIEDLTASASLVFEAEAICRVQLLDERMELASAGLSGLALGANRVLIGSEVLQYAAALPLGGGVWELNGLLRGRGGTELAAQTTHVAGAEFTLIDDRLTSIDLASFNGNGSGDFAAIGLADDNPVIASLQDSGASVKPLTPVHPNAFVMDNGSLCLTWIRRARGAWEWLDQVDVPLIEETEEYRVGIGPVDAPFISYTLNTSRLDLAAATIAQHSIDYPGSNIWVRQAGSYGLSDALLLAEILD